MRKKKSASNIFLDVVAFISSSAMNILIAILAIFLVYTATVSAFNYGKAFTKDETEENEIEEVTIVIPENSNISDISAILKENGLISNKFIFQLQSQLNGTYNLFNSGTYVLDKNIKTSTLMEELSKMPETPTTGFEIYIKPGLTAKQIADLLDSRGLFPAEDFIEACNNLWFDYDFIVDMGERTNRLDGYLFPGVYLFGQDTTPEIVLNEILEQFYLAYNIELRERTNELGMSIDQVISMASIIEKEITNSEEKKLLSSLIHNRLATGMPLQMTSTVVYVVDKRKDRLTQSDLNVKSSYNTYINNGLPLGPICSPGGESIISALYPEETDYLYFVPKNDGTGEHFFTNNYDEYLEAKELYNEKF